MATIRKRIDTDGRARYQAIVRLKGFPTLRNTMPSKAAAIEWGKNVEAEIRTGRMLPRLEASKHTLGDAIDEYIDQRLSELVPKAQQSRRHHLGVWRDALGDYTLADLTPAMISDTRKHLLARGVSAPTTNRYLASLSVVLELSVRELNWMESNPVHRIRRKKESPGRLRYLSTDERDRLLTACQESEDRRMYPLVLFALTTGARRGELLGLKWQDVDLTTLRAVLNKTKNRDRRTLAFPGRAGDVLREWSRTPHISGYLFASGLGKPTFPRKAWHRALKDAQVENFRFHDLRHTAASYLAMSGASLAELATFLGHRSLSMVFRYSHLSEGHTESIATKMAAKFLA